MAPRSPSPAEDRPKNRETDYEDYRPQADGEAPRAATEPKGSEGSARSSKTATDPASGEDLGRPAKP